MPEDDSSRLIRLDERLTRQREELNELKNLTRLMQEKIDELVYTQNRWQWIALGGLGLFALQSMGLSEFLKRVLS